MELYRLYHGGKEELFDIVGVSCFRLYFMDELRAYGGYALGLEVYKKEVSFTDELFDMNVKDQTSVNRKMLTTTETPNM